MHIPPKRRRRALQVHYLRRRGKSLRRIAEQHDISQATVRADLQLAETHWASLAAPAADDLLLESLQLLNIRLTIAIQHDDLAKLADRLTPVDFLRAREARENQLNALAREIRRTVHDVHRRADQRPDQPDLYDEQPQEELQQEPQKLAETITKSDKIEPPNSTISSPQQEIVPDQPQEEKTPENTVQLPDPPDSDPLIEEAVQHFPQLKGQSAEQILQFLDQLTDPDGQTPDIPAEIYADAAG